MAEINADLVPAGSALRGLLAHIGMPVVSVLEGPPVIDPVPLDLPAVWVGWPFPSFGAGRPCVGPLLAQLFVAMGHPLTVPQFDYGPDVSGSNAAVNNSLLITQTGKMFRFSSAETRDYYGQIAAQRLRREWELVFGMDAGRRAVFLEKKRAKLATVAAARVAAAAVPGLHEDVVRALIADADFALGKWSMFP